MFDRKPAATLSLVALATVVLIGLAHGGGIGVSRPAHPAALTGGEDTVVFRYYRVPQEISPRAWRDLEFLWSRNYAGFGRRLDSVYVGTDTELDKFGKTICDVPGSNPFGFPITDIKMMYDYFNMRIFPEIGPVFRDSIYNPDPQAIVAFKVHEPTWTDGDRKHVDTYIYLPAFEAWEFDPGYDGDAGYTGGGVTNSPFSSALEDTSTGHFGIPYAFHGNSLAIAGPHPGGVGRADPAERWTKADTAASWAFNHEFQHVINRGTSTTGTALGELFSSTGETIAGELPEVPQYEVPYSWSLLRKTFSNTLHNYQAWRGFGSYLAFQFRGVDTTSSGRADDLLWRWAGKPGGEVYWAQLADRLAPAECAECTLKTYLRGLSPVNRRELVVHNWRIAMFANKHELAADHQFGFVPNLGFDPIRDLYAWKSFKGDLDDDSVCVPHEITLQTSHLTKDIALSGGPAGQTEVSNPRSTTLEIYGSDYWVIRPAAALGATRRPLTVAVRPEGYCDPYVRRRLMASLILYREHLQGGSPAKLWEHPEWARSVVGPVWADLAAGEDGLELQVPDFGDSTRAVVVVVTLGDPYPSSDALVTGNSVSTANAKLRYRLSVGFRTGTYLSPNPLVGFDALELADARPTFSAAGDTVLFEGYDEDAGERRIYRQALGGGTPTELVQPPGSTDQAAPEWSPRGDWVVYERSVSASQSDLWAYRVRGAESRQLTTSTVHDHAPAFNPNGQRIAYLRDVGASSREVRVVGIMGLGDSLLVARGTASVVGPRWSPDGRHVYFVANDTLYAVAIADRAVVNRGLLAGSTRSFDLPLGAERIVYEQVWNEQACDNPTGTWTHRVVLKDTLAGREVSAFYRPGTRTVTPRWSIDGTRLAFATSLWPGDSCDIRVGQVRNNHAPTWSVPAVLHDYEIGWGSPFSLNLNASDFDGEPMTFVGACLPPGASVVTLNPATGTGRLEWPSPGPLNSEHYVVVRALDPSGGVANHVLKITVVPAGGGGGCPFVDVATADGWITDNSILGRSRTGELGLDAYRLKLAPAVHDGRIRLRLRENEQELTTLDQVRLLAVDHAPVLAMTSAGGEIHWGERVPAWRVTTSRGEDITSLVSGQPGSLGWRGSPGDTVLVEMTDPATGRFGLTGTQDGGGGSGEGSEKEVEVVYDPSTGGGRYAASPVGDPPATPAALTDGTWLDRTGIRVQVPDGAGGWQDLTHWYPRANRDDSYFPGLTHDTARLIFVGRHGLSFFGRLRPKSGAVNQTALEPLAASHTRLGDARSAIGGTAEATELAPGDSLYLEFAPPPPVEGMVREYFLVTRGVYTSNLGTARLQPQAPRVPGRYALLQNVPNPFASTTAIQFELPRAEQVTLEVFDLLGRRVRTLAGGEWPAGYHAVEWDRTSEAGTRLRAGVYLYRLTAGSFRDQKKMVIGAR